MPNNKLEKLFKKAKSSEANRKHKKAAILYTKIIKKNSKLTITYLERAKIIRNHANELASFRKKLYLKDKKRKEKEEFLSQKIRFIETLFEKEKNEQPETYHFSDDLIKIIEIDKNYVQVWFFIKNQISDIEQKLKIIDIILQIEPENKRALQEQFEIYKKQNDENAFKKAIKNFLKIYPNDYKTHLELGNYYLENNDFESAYYSFSASKSEKQISLILCKLKKLAFENTPQAKSFLNKIQVPETPFYTIGLENFLAQNYKIAENNFWSASIGAENEHNRTKAIIFQHISKYYYSLLKKPEQNIETFHKAVMYAIKKSKEKTTELILAEIYEEAGFNEFAKNYHELVEKKKSSTERKEIDLEHYYITQYNFIIQNSRNYQSALKLAEEALTRLGKKLNLLEIRGDAYYNVSQITKARSDFKRVLKLNPQSYIALKGLVLIEAGGNSYNKAVLYLEDFIKLFGKESWTDDLVKKIPPSQISGNVENFIKKY
ncbi:MAG: hypothetical protein JXL97_02330 [Bacteroidales bacterium]|nr:hypothetical protein [Bacteroidales bacterium]